jgi:hypothetical protein
LCEFLSGRRTLGLSPRFGVAQLDIIPADYVAQVIAWSSTTSTSTGRIIHSCSGPELALPLISLRNRVRRSFTAAGRRVPPLLSLRPGVFRAVLSGISVFMPGDVRRAIKTLPVFLDYLATEQSFANSRTQGLLAPAGLAVPSPNSYLEQVLDYYLQNVKQR